ncbi:2-oxoglutarate dehydrogenase complex dihydrolipoyllysine-residue succinyltransferase [Tundrisphaera lichenicola]|uniref:2-oxoglutarate dehydrogenase complex dihydrolipoyllysine-residue succinyltransferase n=1 Tax=Tundrisphaera lichenicola TaxID=2029860 RepID=UPI003EBECFD4
MAAVPIKVPQVSESITEGILANWLKPDGSVVKSGEPLYELETDKASQVFISPAAGTLKIQVAEGTTVAVEAVIGSIDPDGVPTAKAPEPAKPAPSKAVEPPSKPAAPEVRPVDGSTSNGGVATMPLAPSVRRIVEESGTDPSRIEGTGREGRLTKGDVLAHLETPRPVAPATSTDSPAPVPAPNSGPRESRKRMSGLRQKIAQRLVEAQHTAAILTTFNEADMSQVMELRAKYKDSFKAKHGIGLGFSSFFIKATIEALKAFPNVNGRIEGNEIVTNHAYDIGVAVSTERGLMVPVIRDADKLSFAGIEKAIGQFAVKAREGTIAVSDLQGGTFTITNGGVFGSLLSTPILNPPQSGILGMHAIQKRPIAVDDQVVIRPMMYLALSYDHRIVDGREAVSFLVRIKECIESPERLMLEL